MASKKRTNKGRINDSHYWLTEMQNGMIRIECHRDPERCLFWQDYPNDDEGNDEARWALRNHIRRHQGLPPIKRRKKRAVPVG